MSDRVQAQRTIPVDAATIFGVLCDPRGHVAIDGSGMLMSADGEAVSAVGDEFVVHMDREALGDLPMGHYDVRVIITAFAADREIAWTVIGVARPPVGHVYGYTLEPVEGGTLVTSYHDWTDIHPEWRAKREFPVVPPSALAASLGILARTVTQPPYRSIVAGTAGADQTSSE